MAEKSRKPDAYWKGIPVYVDESIDDPFIRVGLDLSKWDTIKEIDTKGRSIKGIELAVQESWLLRAFGEDSED